MANLKAIRKRIHSVKNTQKITRAMKMVAAARLRRAQQAIMQARPYALETLDVLSSVAARAGDEEVHPLLAKREPKNVMLVIITSDRGLAGAFNTSITKAAYKLLKQLEGEGKTVSIATIGRKGRDFFARRGCTMRHEFVGIFEQLGPAKAQEIGHEIIAAYTEAQLDAVYLVYNEFKSVIAQEVVTEPLLPIKPLPASTLSNDSSADFIYEPNKKAILDTLLPMYVNVEVYRALLESVASEHGARMTAMDNATKNAAEMLGKLTLQFNRARQAAITTELMEIIGGSEALKG
jgi:F-type H+-transporting ATPase subunit gamma